MLVSILCLIIGFLSSSGYTNGVPVSSLILAPATGGVLGTVREKAISRFSHFCAALDFGFWPSLRDCWSRWPCLPWPCELPDLDPLKLN